MTIPSNPYSEVDESLDLKKYLFLILANWYWFVISVFVGLGIAWLINRYTMPVYNVSASLIINDDDRGRGLSGYENLIPGMEIFRNQKKVLNEIEILKSFSLATKTVKQLDFDVSYMAVGRSGIKESVLYNNSPFIVEYDSINTNPIGYPIFIDILNKEYYEISIDNNFNIKEKVKFGQKFEAANFSFTIVLRSPEAIDPQGGYSKYYFYFNDISGLAVQYKGMLNIESNDAKRGSVLFLSMSGYNAQQITNYINTLMQVYILQGLEEKNQTAINTVNFIDMQLKVIDESLKEAEKNLQDFRLENKLLDISREGGLIYTKLESSQEQKLMLTLQERYYQYLKKYVQNRNNLNQVVAPSTVSISDPLLGGLITQLNLLLGEKEELLFSVNEGNPQISIIDSKIETTREALLNNIENLINNNNISSEEINKQYKLAEKDLAQLPVTERMLINIQRQYKVNDQIYTYLLQKRAEAAIAKASNVADNKILDIARVESAGRIFPKTRMNFMLGLILGILLPLVFLILMDLLNNKISSRNDIDQRTSVPIISSIGHSSEGGDIPVFENPKSALSESFRGLRTNLQYLLREKDQKVITITSTVSGEGKTFSSVNLAAIYAMAGKKTLLMGLDLRKPKVHKVFNVDNTIGISNFLVNKASLKEIVRDTKIENLFIAPAGPIPPNPAELLESPAMADMIHQARDIYDIIILDTPPFGMVTDALLVSRLSDLSLFIVRQNYSSRNVIELFEELFNKKELKHLGIVINDIRHKGSYGYGYRYYNYGYTYRYGYYE
jgi:capsular exopolysaccharide synthesis family protein